MRHPNEATLALHAGGDLGPIARWKVERHLNLCERCRADLAGFEAIRRLVPELSETPEVSWNRLASEMKANIRLGLSAGECVRSDAPPRPGHAFGGARVAVAFASIITLLVTGLMLHRPSPAPFRTAGFQGIELQAVANGIQLREGRETLKLLHGVKEERNVSYLPGAQGSMRNQYLDPQTGYVTMTTVYAD